MWRREGRESWKGDGAEGWPRKRLEWFRERLALMVAEMMTKAGHSNQTQAEVLAELWEIPERLCLREPLDRYRGNHYNAFEWRIDEAAVVKEINEILVRRRSRRAQEKLSAGEQGGEVPPAAAPEPEQHVHHLDTEKHAAGWQAFSQRGLLLPHAYHHPAKRWTHRPAPTPPPDFPSLDAWLDAERTGKLTHVPVYEPFSIVVMDSAWHLGIVPHHEVQALSDRLSEANMKRRDNPWPRVCCKCGAEFRPLADGRQRKAKRVRCEKCRKRGA